MLLELLEEKSKKYNFLEFGVLDIEKTINSPEFKEHLSRYDRWLSQGHSAEMEYLKRGRDRRSDPRYLLNSAKSMVVVAIPYSHQPAGNLDASLGPRYARYLQGPDYHVTVKEKLENWMIEVQNGFNQKLEWKICVDTSAILERTWAALAGLGWIGKNTLLIHPKHGSYFFLAEILINKKITEKIKNQPNLCGNCERCLRSCPTDAFENKNELNSNKCISYLTLEKKGEFNFSDDIHGNIFPWIAGCDLCQEVCPFNLKISKTKQIDFFENDATQLNTWLELEKETETEYKVRVSKSSLKRVKFTQFKRNLQLLKRNP